MADDVDPDVLKEVRAGIAREMRAAMVVDLQVCTCLYPLHRHHDENCLASIRIRERHRAQFGY